jgi:hypothetical protein
VGTWWDDSVGTWQGHNYTLPGTGTTGVVWDIDVVSRYFGQLDIFRARDNVVEETSHSLVNPTPPWSTLSTIF